MKKVDLLGLEGDKAIWEYRNLGGAPLYLMIRFRLLQSMIDRKFNLSNPHVMPRLNIQAKLTYIAKAFIYNPFRLKRSHVVIFSSGAVNAKKNDGFFYNRLYQYFLESSTNQISIIETSNKFCFNTPKKSKVFYRDFLDIVLHLFSSQFLVKRREIRVIEEFIAYLERSGVSDSKKYYQSLIRSVAKYKVGYHIYRYFFKVKKPNLIIVEDASYGGLCYLVRAAKSLNIEVAEYQHGYIGLNHPAYNLNCVNLPKDIDQFLPSFFLTHGDYWSEQCRLPAQKVAIGYPDLISRLSGYEATRDAKQTFITILFISGGTVPSKLVSFIKRFAELNPSFEVILRPHPSERPEMQERYSELLRMDVQLDTDSLFETLSQVDVLVGFEVSTVLYESIFFTNKVYLVDDDYANFYEPSSPFLRFDSVESLTANIKVGSQLDISPDYFWARDYENRFSEFMQSQING